jgi:putative N6-adenine-specific DNA methylase
LTGFAVIQPGLEAVVADELRAHGVEPTVQPGGVRFAGDAARVRQLGRELRTPSQLLLELGEGRARTPDQLGALVRRLPWRSLLPPNAPFAVTVTSKGSALRFRDAAARTAQTAIREALKGPFVPDRGPRPRVTQAIQVRIVDDAVTVSLDAGGELLHRRGWRTEAGKAPLRENVAACMLALGGFSLADALLDPFCGAGTVVIEAALARLGRAPFGRRAFACDEWCLPAPRPSAPASRHRATGSSATNAVPFGPPLVGSDHHSPSLTFAAANARRAGVRLRFELADVSAVAPPAPAGLIVTNPPWGERLGAQVTGVYVAFGRVLRERFGGWRALFLAPDPRLAGAVDRRAAPLAHIRLGGIPVGIWALDLS